MIALAGGDRFCLALRADGTVVAWGDSSAINVPANLTNAVAIAAGSSHSWALRSDGTLTEWGFYLNGAYAPNFVPSAATNVVALALGPGQLYTLVLRADGTLVDWGGDADAFGLTNIPPTAQNIVSVAAGSYHSVALRSDGHVVAWGQNSQGQTNIPTGATNIVAIAAGWYGNAALRADGSNLYWGSISVPPTSPQLAFTNIIDIACPFDQFGNCSILALRRDGTVVGYSTSAPANLTNIVAVGAYSFGGLALAGSGPPAFPQRLLNRSVIVGATAYFRSLAIGAMPLSYQWTCNGTNIPGATNTILVVKNAQLTLAGNYYSLIASNGLGLATNNVSTLNVTPSEIYIQPPSLTTVAGAPVTFTVGTNGQGPFTFQWLLNGTSLAGATNKSLSIPSVQLTDAGSYSVIVSNVYGNVSANAPLLVQPFMFNTSSTGLLLATNGLRLQLGGVFATNSVVVYASTDLVSWLPILTNSPATGAVQFLDTTTTNWPMRFYRAAEQ